MLCMQNHVQYNVLRVIRIMKIFYDNNAQLLSKLF